MLNELEKIEIDIPKKCNNCGSNDIKYIGVGEYECMECHSIMYDNYGTVRNYIEKHPGATQAEVSAATGVGKHIIRRLLQEDRIQIAQGSVMFLHCEKCGNDIRSGRYCRVCQKIVDDEKNKANGGSKITGGFSKIQKGAAGSRRFSR